MSRPVRIGYCRDCQANVNHVRRFVSNLGWLLDSLTFRFAGRFRIGSWHCLQCTRNSTYLSLPLPGARKISIGSSNSKAESAPTESSGNYIQRDRSLVARRERSSRYSAKYRESIVQKILEGHVTIAEIRRELDLSEADLIDWIAIVVETRSEKIAQLTRIIQVFSADGQIRALETTIESQDDVLDSSPAQEPLS